MSFKENLYRPVGALKTLARTISRRRTAGNGPRLFLLNIPSHGNLGDHLISVAEQVFLSTYFPAKRVEPVTSADLFFSISFALADVKKDDILCVTGGGFMGSLYAEEKRFLKIIDKFPDNKIVFFPQSFYYAPSKDRQRMIERAAKVYGRHKSLFVAARDNNSYSLLRNELMPGAAGRISLVPDIALFLHPAFRHSREGVLYCIRNDAESLPSNASIVNEIKSSLSEKGFSGRFVDTYVSRSIPLDKEADEVSIMLEEFAKAKLVVTDRLHGMIFAVITDTPVIVLDNVTGKVRQLYDMCLKDLPFVKFVNDSSNVESCIDGVLSAGNCTYDHESIKQLYLPIINAIEA